MEEEIITEERAKWCLRKTKTKKAVSPDAVKPEFYKVFLDIKILLDTLTSILKHTAQIVDIPEAWRESSTVMIPKQTNPKLMNQGPQH